MIKGGLLMALVLLVLLLRGRNPLPFPQGAGKPAPQVEEDQETRSPDGWEGVALFPEAKGD